MMVKRLRESLVVHEAISYKARLTHLKVECVYVFGFFLDGGKLLTPSSKGWQNLLRAILSSPFVDVTDTSAPFSSLMYTWMAIWRFLFG